MIIYKDILTGDELFTDTFPMEVVDDIFYKVKGKHITEKAGSIDDALIGGNASAEGGDEAAAVDEEGAVSGVDVVIRGRLVETGFGKKKEYQAHIKEYMGKVVDKLKENNPGRVDDFKKNAQTAIKKVLENFKEYQFFMGESMDPDGMNALCIYEGETPYIYFFKDGLEEEKV